METERAPYTLGEGDGLRVLSTSLRYVLESFYICTNRSKMWAKLDGLAPWQSHNTSNFNVYPGPREFVLK